MFDITKVFEEVARVVIDACGEAMGPNLAKTVAIVGGGIFAGAIAATTLPRLYDSHENKKFVQARFSQIDATRSDVFTSVAKCVEQGHRKSLCETSEYSARLLWHIYGARVEYDNQEKCVMKHWNCGDKDQVIVIPSGIFTGKRFRPMAQGWVASKADLEKSALLYAGPRSDTLVRQDGREFKMVQ